MQKRELAQSESSSDLNRCGAGCPDGTRRSGTGVDSGILPFPIALPKTCRFALVRRPADVRVRPRPATSGRSGTEGLGAPTAGLRVRVQRLHVGRRARIARRKPQPGALPATLRGHLGRPARRQSCNIRTSPDGMDVTRSIATRRDATRVAGSAPGGACRSTSLPVGCRVRGAPRKIRRTAVTSPDR
jgi:hypothetical protein